MSLCLCASAQDSPTDSTTPPATGQSVAIDPATESIADETLGRVEGLEQGDATIVGDTIEITGTAEDSSVVADAIASVIAATGVSRVESRIDLSLNLQDRTRGAVNRVGQRAEIWIAYLPLIPIALAVLLVFVFLSWLIGRWTWLFGRVTDNPFLQDIARRVSQALVLLMGVLLALEILDAMALVGGVLGAAGVAGIAIGFAFKDLIENYIASILLSLRQPFRPRDHVVIDGYEGLVTSMNARTTVLTTFDGNIVRIPNSVVFKTTLINYDSDPRRRFDFTVGVGYDVDLALAIDVGVTILLRTEGVLSDPKPFAIVTKLGDSSITIQLFAWVEQTKFDFARVQSVAMQRVKNEYDRLNIDMPEPIYKIRMAQEPLAGDPADPASTPSTGVDEPPARTPSQQQDVRIDQTAHDMARDAAAAEGSENLLDSKAAAE